METSRDSSTALASELSKRDRDALDSTVDQGLNHDQLSSQDFVELTRVSRKKDDIERHIASLQSWPYWDPFKDVSSYSTDTASLKRSRRILDKITDELRGRQIECDRLELGLQQFNLDDMKRLRSVAKAVSKRHLSDSDTDLLELALETVFALDKLLRLLRERRTEHDLTHMRLQWEDMVCSSWRDVVDLRRSIEAFERKCATLTAPQMNVNGASVLEASEGDHTNTQRSMSSSQKQIPRSASSSFKLISESLKLESSRLVLRIRSFDNEKVRAAGRLLDLLIDQIQVPEILIDEQEKLEAALPEPSRIEEETAKILSVASQTSHSSSRGQHVEQPSTSEPKGESPAGEAKPGVTDFALEERLPAGPERVPNGRTHTHKQPAIGFCKGSFPSSPATPARNGSHHYRSDPRDALDVAIGNIVNRMHIAVSIKNASMRDATAPARSGTFKNQSGQYWIGEPDPRLCFCRILPSSMVMVRVGGGWQELSEFLMQHYAHLDLQEVHDGTAPARGSNRKLTPNSTWMRSASGPAGSPRLRTRSSVGSLRSCPSTDQETVRHSSRIVTMPAMKSRPLVTPVIRPGEEHIPSITRRQAAVEQRDRSLSTPCKASDLPSSDSTSSIIIHYASPSP